eukprot:Lithocolla_globosa_v1_NODE_444_length_4028_cov_25.911905.p2 type:complete len:116 gc:universal NODE_444_length_4028_cov_25.911905:3450-3797(+)
MENHKLICENTDYIREIFPKEGEQVSFRNHTHSILIPHIIYADFEAFIKFNKHEINSYAFKVVNTINPQDSENIVLKHDNNSINFLSLPPYPLTQSNPSIFLIGPVQQAQNNQFF